MPTDHKNRTNKIHSMEDLLQDEYFITSMTSPTPESEEYWFNTIREGQIDIHDYNLARFFIDSVQTKSEKMKMEEKHNLWENIEFENKQKLKRQRKNFRIYLSVASGLVAIFIVAFLLNKSETSLPEDTLSIVHKEIEDVTPPDTSTSDIRLILAGDKCVSLEGREADIIYNNNGIAINNQETTLKNDPSDHKTIYNQLIVPLGKRSLLTFAEGSKIWVNAGTRVVYPASFNEEKREIYIDGEAFLDITPNPECPFIVKTRDHIIEVLGTSFNITAYENDSIRKIVLISGSVKINSPDSRTDFLSPNELFTYTNGTPAIETVDVDAYISWKSGIYQYHSENLGTILQRLSRYYGKEIDCPKHISHLKCTGKLDLKDDLQIVLNGIARMAPTPLKFELSGEKYIVSDE